MGIRSEEFTLPIRFLLLTAHFVMVLTVLFNVQATTINLTYPLRNPNLEGAGQKDKAISLSYAALACFGIEYITLFLGVSIFIRPLQALNIVAHFIGVILVYLFYVDSWTLGAYIAFVVLFNFLPVLIELLVLGLMSRFTYARF